MTERRIFKNICHVPKIWGVPYPKVFASVGLLLFCTVGGNVLAGGSSTIGKVLVIVGSVLISASLHCVFLLMERVDVLERELTFIKNEQNSQSISLQSVNLKATAPHPGKGKNAVQ
jgi:hypothetical protein